MVKKGDTVLYGRSEIDEFHDGEDIYTFLFEEQGVLAVVEPHPVSSYPKNRGRGKRAGGSVLAAK